MNLTLDWDALGQLLPPLEESLEALRLWVASGGQLRIRTAAAMRDPRAAFAAAGIALATVEQRPQPAPWSAAQSAEVEEGAVVGAGARIWRYTHVRSGALVGEGSSLGQGVFVDAGAILGANCKIQNGVNIYRGVLLGDDVFVGPSTTFTNDLRPRARGDWRLIPTLVGNGASIGANATVVCGSHLGACAMVGAGAVVIRPVPPHGLMAGVPARQIGWVCQCGERVAGRGPDGHYRCPACSSAAMGEASEMPVE